MAIIFPFTLSLYLSKVINSANIIDIVVFGNGYAKLAMVTVVYLLTASVNIIFRTFYLFSYKANKLVP